MANRWFRAAVTLGVLAFGCRKEAPPAEPAPTTSASEPSAIAEVGTAEPATKSHLSAAVAHSARPAKDKERDADRKPAQVLEFFGIAPGMTVMELMSGTGYYAEILGHAVGAEGQVLAQNSPWVLERFAEKPLTERLAKPSLSNVKRVDAELDKFVVDAESLDAALMILFYHDTYWMKVDRAEMNKRIFGALKPGGVYGVIDHHAAEGAQDSVVKTLHRGDAEMIKGEILAAGFELEAESNLLRNPADDRQRNVFEPAMRGKTDRFIFKFRKPAAAAE